MGVVKCSDAIAMATAIYINFTENAFDFIMRACLGIARNVHEDQGLKKSLNISETFQITSDYEQIKAKLEKLCKELEGRAKNQGLSGRTLTVEFKSDKFKNKQQSHLQALKDNLIRAGVPLIPVLRRYPTWFDTPLFLEFHVE